MIKAQAQVTGPTKETESDSERTQGQDRRLLAGYLHKTSNTLCGIKGYASLIADPDFSEQEAGSWARKIIAEVERMEDIFRSVGDLTRGRGHPDIGVDLKCLVADVAQGFEDSTSRIALNLGPVPEGELRLPAADLTLLLTEILRNAAESRISDDAVPTILLDGFCADDGGVFVRVRDNGCGMDPDLLRQAADPFVTTKDDHHGVGLTRVATLMEMYGLTWNLRSEENRGTLVEVEVAEVL